MEQVKSIALISLGLLCVLLWFKPAPYVSPEYVEIPALITDSMKTRIISDANSGYLVGTEEEFKKRFGKTVTKTKWNIKDSLRIQDSLHIDTLRYVSILTDSTEYRVSQLDSSLGVGFDLTIGLSDTVILEPYDKFIHDFWLDSLTWKIADKPEVELGWVEWFMKYPKKIVITALTFLLLGKF